MCRKVLLILFAATAMTVSSFPVDAQGRRRAEQPPVLRVTPRSFLNPGTVVQPGSISPGVTGYGQTQSYLLSPPYAPEGARFGLGLLPDPVTNGPFVGARNPFGPVDYVAPPGAMR